MPAALREAEGTLDSMRRIRNDVAHQFGREKPTMGLGLPERATHRVALARLQKFLATASGVAAAIEAHLLPAHIGEFELLEYYHRWRAGRVTGDSSGIHFRAAYVSALGGKMGVPARAFFRAVVGYYGGA